MSRDVCQNRYEIKSQHVTWCLSKSWWDKESTCHVMFLKRCSYVICISYEFEFHSLRGMLNKTLCDKVCQWLAVGREFSQGTPVFSTNKTNSHDIAEQLLKVVLATITITIYALDWVLKNVIQNKCECMK